jgi:general secretion pathway protein D
MRWRMRSCLLLLVLLPRLALADATQVAPPPSAEDDALVACNRHPGEVAVTFKPELELKELVTWATGFSCKNFIYEPRIISNRKIAILAPDRMRPAEAYQLFLASLATMGLAVVPAGKALRIVEAQTVKGEAVPIVKTPGDGADLERFVLRPTYAKPETLASAFDSLKSVAGDVKQLGSVLVITDYANHIHDMVALAKLIDVPGGTDGIYTVPVLHADATKLQAKLQDILGTTTAPAAKAPTVDSPNKILVDERTNTLIVVGTEAAYQRARALVDRLDIALGIEGGASIHVYQLGNAIAEEVAKVLNDAIQQRQQSGAGSGSAAPKAVAPVDSLALEGSAHVIADAKSNKLVVTSSGRDFLAIKDVIQQLDEPRRQVFIETVILDVQSTNGLDVGSSSHGTLPTDGGNAVVLGGVQNSSLKSTDITSSLAAATGLIAGLVGSPVTGAAATTLGTSFPSYALLFQALATQSRTNIVSTPSIIALDNEDAKFHVGTNVPYKKGVVPITSTSPLSGTTTNIDRQDLNFELDIKPHISANDNVLLEIKNDSKELGTTDAELGPSWNTRGFETRVVVHDQQTIVLNGLVQEREVVTTSKVPLLGDLPLLGYAFKYTSRTRTRSNLLILLTPYIVKDQLELQEIQTRKLREHEEFVAANRALDHMKYQPRMDYRRKRGVVEEINRAVQLVEEDTAARAAIQKPAHVEPGVVQ